jgi:hypothetical protein
MKKITSLAIVSLFVAASFVSCKKDYTCTCTTVSDGINSESSITIKDTKSKAKSTCSSYESNTSMLGMTITTTCALK